MCDIFTEDGRLESVELPVLLGCVDDEVLGWGFLLDAENQFVGEDGYWVQPYGERSGKPLTLVKQREFKDSTSLLDQIYHEAQAKAKEDQYTAAAKNKWAESISWIITVCVGSALLLFGIIWFTR
jgi:hypothetical protein